MNQEFAQQLITGVREALALKVKPARKLYYDWHYINDGTDIEGQFCFLGAGVYFGCWGTKEVKDIPTRYEIDDLINDFIFEMLNTYKLTHTELKQITAMNDNHMNWDEIIGFIEREMIEE